ncbi:retinitis pigmentosa 1-like 1 protein isoform X2 [Manis javanica]
MNSSLRDAQALSHRECLLPFVARTASVTHVMPAKKITFLKRGDPQFAGVRLAVHQRAFRSFGALMDELSQRMPLSFGVRSVTTPRGLHGLSALEQLEDGGFYLCSDKKSPKTPSGPGQSQGRSPSALQVRDVPNRGEVPGTSSSCKGPKAPRRTTLVKNGDPRFQQTVVLSHRNTRNLTAFLTKASDLLHFPVKQVYTASGEKVDSLKHLLCSPSVLVCAGHEPFRPLTVEDARRHSTELLSGKTSRNKNGSWGPKAKQSVIHLRSRAGSRPRKLSLLSERSGFSDAPVSLDGPWVGPAPDRHPQDVPAQLSPLVADDDLEKKVHVNEDGSLSVEMKVRFHLLGEDTRLWSRRARAARVLTAAGQDGPLQGEVGPVHSALRGHPGGSSGPGAGELGPCKEGCKQALPRGQWQPGCRYEIWTNPLYTAQGKGKAPWRRSGPSQHSLCRRPWGHGAAGKWRGSEESARPAPQDRHPRDSEPSSSSCSGSPRGGYGPHPASRAASQSAAGQEAGGRPWAAEGPEGTAQGSREPHRPRGAAAASSPSPASAWSHQESSSSHHWRQGPLSKRRATTSRKKATQVAGPGAPTTSPPSLRSGDPQAGDRGQGPRHPRAGGGSGNRLPLGQGCSGSGDTAGGSPPSDLGGGGNQEGRTRGQSSGLSSGAQCGCPRQPPTTHLDLPVSPPGLGPPGGDRACPDGPSEGSATAGNPASRDPGPPSSAPLHSQDTRGLSRASATFVSSSDRASSCYPPSPGSAETEGDPECGTCSPAPTASSTSDPLSPREDSLRERAGGRIPAPSWPWVPRVGQPEGGQPGAHREICCSQLSTDPLRGTPGAKTWVLQASGPQGCQGPFSETCMVCSRHCPTPPGTWPLAKRRPSCGSSHSAEWGLGRSEPGKEKLHAWRPRPPGPQPVAAAAAGRVPRSGSPSCGPRPGRMPQGMAASRGKRLREQGAEGSLLLGALPRASPEAVVREWLSHVPEEPTPVEREMVPEGTDGAGDNLQGPQGKPADIHSQEGPGEPTRARQLPLGGATSGTAAPEGALTEPGSAGPKPGAGLPGGGVSEAPPEAAAGRGTAMGGTVGRCELPHRVLASTQIMKALVGCRQGRPSSLPEVSGAVGRRLSHSAGVLIACLAGLHFFDNDLGSPTSEVRFADSPRYQKLLSTLQALWPGCGFGHGEPDSGLWELGWYQAVPGLGSLAVTEDLTPTSSSGVDVGSGSGGSGEGTGPCIVDCALVPEQMELPLKIPYQRPDSRTSKNPEDLGNRELRGSTGSSNAHAGGCAARKDMAGGSGGQQAQSRNLHQEVENVIQEMWVQLEEMKKERGGAEVHGAGVRGLPEEGRVPGKELSGSQDGEGVQEGTSSQEERAGRDPASAVLTRPGGTENLAEPSGSVGERDLDTSGSQSGPKVEPDLEKMPGAAETGQEQSQAVFAQEPGEQSCPAARGESPDPPWVSTLLRKMEEAFLAHLADATAELRARWSLRSNDLLDQMVAELRQDMSRRLQGSSENELGKVRSRAPGSAPGPPGEALRWGASLPAEQRRHRLQDLHNLSALPNQAQGRGPLPFSLEDVPNLSGAQGRQQGAEAEGEDFCPCEACVRKTVIPTALQGAVGASAPIKKAFDLRQILQKKKGGWASGEPVEAAPEKRGVGVLPGDPLRPGTVQRAHGGLELGLGGDPGTGGGVEGEGIQSLVHEEGEDADAPESPEKADPHMGRDVGPVDGEGKKEEGGSSGGGDPSPGGQNDGPEAIEVQEAGGGGQPGPGRGSQGEEGDGAQVGQGQSQWGEASGSSSPDQEERPWWPPTLCGHPPCERAGLRTGLSSSSPSSLGSVSHLSQKGSRDWRSTEGKSEGAPGAERKVTSMYPESPTSEQEGTPWGPRTPEQGAAQGSAAEAEKVVRSLTFTEMGFKNPTTDRAGAFGQDDLDF